MTLGPGDRGPSAAARGHLRASDADREQMVDTLKAAFAAGRAGQGRLRRPDRPGVCLPDVRGTGRGHRRHPGRAGRGPAARAQAVPAGERRSPVGRIRVRYASHSCYRFRAEFPARKPGPRAGHIRDRVRLFRILDVGRGRYALAVVLLVLADGENVRQVRAYCRLSPRADVLLCTAWLAQVVQPLLVCGLCPAGSFAEDRGSAHPVDSSMRPGCTG